MERERAGELRVCRALHMQENHVGVVLHVTYTDAYPDEPPIWELEEGQREMLHLPPFCTGPPTQQHFCTYRTGNKPGLQVLSGGQSG